MDVLLENGIVRKVGPCNSNTADAAVTVDGMGRLLTAGLVNAHTHFYGRSAVGMQLKDESPKTFGQILERLWWKLDRSLTMEAVRLGAMICMVEALEAGTTTLFDHHSSPTCAVGSLKAIAEAAQLVGARVVLAYETTDRNGRRAVQDAIEENAWAAKQGLPNLFGLHAAFTLSDETLSQCLVAAKAANSPGFHIHVAEGPEDAGAVERLSKAGILGPNTVIGHGVHLNDEEIATVAASGSTVVVNVQSNLGNGVGLPRMSKFAEAGIPICIGTDGMTHDMLQEIRCLLLQKLATPSIVVRALLETNPAMASKATGLSLGKVCEGFSADLVLWDYNPATPLTNDNVLAHLQFGVQRVQSVWVGGKLVVNNGRITTINKRKVWDQFRDVVEKFVWTSPELNRFPGTLESTSFYGQDFHRTWDWTIPQLTALLMRVKIVRERHAQRLSCRLPSGIQGLAVSNFRDKSTRTRFAFASAASLCGLDCFNFDESTSQVVHGETVRETAVMSALVSQVIGIRDDLYIGLGEKYMRDVSEALHESHGARGIFPGVPIRPTVINLQSDVDHPTQTLSDLLHLQTIFGPNLRGIKVALTWAFSPSYGKPLSVPGGLIALLPRFGVHLVLAHPPGFDLLKETVDAAHRGALEGGGKFTVVHRMEDALQGAHVVYAKSWGAQDFMMHRVQEFQNKTATADSKWEKEYLQKLEKELSSSWEYNEDKRKLTSDAILMHCLPADISGISCERGEVAGVTFERDRIDMYREASWKPYVIAAMMQMQRSK